MLKKELKQFVKNAHSISFKSIDNSKITRLSEYIWHKILVEKYVKEMCLILFREMRRTIKNMRVHF